MRRLAVLFALILTTAACNKGEPPRWHAGPVIDGRNYSVGMDGRLQLIGSGFAFAFPQAPGSVHYVTKACRPLQGTLRLRYVVEAAPGSRFVPSEAPDEQALLSVYFQREGDTWSARGKYAAFRWYSLNTLPLTPGEHTMELPLTADHFVPVVGSTPAIGPAEFAEAARKVDRCGLTFGWAGGRGHGMASTGQARFQLLEFGAP